MMTSRTARTGRRFSLTPIALIAGGIGLATLPGWPAHAEPTAGGAISDEDRANRHTTSYQDVPVMAMNARGEFVVAWRSYGQNGANRDGVFARAYRADGSRLTGEIRVSSSTLDLQRPTHVAIDADGDFAVLWAGYGTNGYGAFVRAFTAAGAPRTQEMPVHSVKRHRGFPHYLWMDDEGDFVAHWITPDDSAHDKGVWIRAYQSDGTPRRPDQLILSAGLGGDPLVATGAENGAFAVAARTHNSIDARFLDADGLPIGHATVTGASASSGTALTHLAAGGDGVVVVWKQTDGSGDGAFARAFHANGSSRTAAFRLSAYTVNAQTPAAIAMSKVDGDFIIVWNSVGQDGSGDGVYARIFEGSGVAKTGPFRVSVQVAGNQTPGLAGIDGAGNFVVAWRGQDGSGSGIFARVYESSGAPRTGEIAINTITAGEQSPAQLAVDPAGNFVLVWTGTDADGHGVRARVFSADGTPASDELVVNQAVTRSQQASELAMDGQGHFAVSWTSTQLAGSDDDVMVRRFAGAAPVDLSLAMTEPTEPVDTVTPFPYTFTVTNEHAVESDPAAGVAHAVRLVDTLPPGFTLASYSGTGWTCEGTSVVRCELTTALLPGTTSGLVLNVRAAASTAGLTPTSSVTLDAAQFDPDQSDNTVTAQTAVGLCGSITLAFRQAEFVRGEDERIARVWVERVGAACGTVSVDYATSPASASQADFVATSGTLTWAHGQTLEKSFLVSLVQDSEVEGDELIDVLLSNPSSGVAAGGPAVIRIVDDDD